MIATDADAFERRVRLAYSNEDCPLDVSPSTIQRFAGFSSFGPVREDARVAALTDAQLRQLDAACDPRRTAKRDAARDGTEGRVHMHFQHRGQKQEQEQEEDPKHEPKQDCVRGTDVADAKCAQRACAACAAPAQ